MRVIQKERPSGGRVAALGTFDGIQQGHCSLIRNAKRLAEEMNVPLRVCTFNRHPLEVLQPDRPPEMLSTIPEKASRMCRLGVDEMELIRFDRKTADMEPEEFLERLRSMTDLRAVVAGWNYTFGRKGRGDADTLAADGRINGYKVLIVPPERLEDGTPVSSSLVRQKLKEGNIAEAERMLGCHYSITGTVVPGTRQGRTLGYPTANIHAWKRKAMPKYGVYACLAETDGKTFPAVTNIGTQPTIPSGNVTVEAHILEPCEGLYGKKMRLTLLTMIREERLFRSPEELKEQIGKDREDALRLFNMA